MASYLNPSSTASAGTAIGKDPDARGGLRERARIVGGVHRLLSGGVAQDYTGTLRRWQLRWTGLTNAQWAVIKSYIQGGYQLYWQGPEMSAKVAVILEDVEQDQVHLNGDSAAAPHWNVSLTLREGTLANAVQYVYGAASITLGAVTLSSAGTFAGTSGLLTSLISYWKLDEASGTRVDSVTASANDLTDNNTVTQNPGKISNAGQFTAVNTEYLSHTDNASLSTGDIDFTVAAWVYADTLPSGAGIVQKGNGGGAPNHEFDLFYRGTGTAFAFRIANGALLAQDNTVVPPSTGTWYFVVGWHDSVANTVNIQVNNNTAVSVATAGVAPTDTAFDFMIGRSVQSGVYWNGRIDEVGFWKRVLTATERTNLYNAGAGVTYPFTGVP